MAQCKIRIFAFLAASLTMMLPLNYWFWSSYYALVFGHFALAYWYSSKRVISLGRSTPLVAISVLILGALAFQVDVPALVWAFLFHHVFSEIYALGVKKHDRRFEVGGRGVLNGLLYMYLLRTDLGLDFLANELLTGYLAFFVLYFGSLPKLGGRIRTGNVGFEAIGVCVAIASFIWGPATFKHLVIYHNATWLLIPALKMQTAPRAIKTYIARSAIVYGIAFMACAFLLQNLSVMLAMVDHHAAFWAYMHIASSLLLSADNPSVVIRLFQRGVSSQPGSAKGSGPNFKEAA